LADAPQRTRFGRSEAREEAETKRSKVMLEGLAVSEGMHRRE
jgi:hypothetical protein